MAGPTAPSSSRRMLTPDTAYFLTAAGALPFIAGAGIALFGDAMNAGWACGAVRYYGAVILSFMGGIHWGLAMGPDGTAPPVQGKRLMLSVVPALIAWLALLIPEKSGIALLTIAFVLLLPCDLKAAERGYAPCWYPRMRKPVTLVVVLCLTATSFAAWTM